MSETSPLILTFDGKGGHAFLENVSQVRSDSGTGKQVAFCWVHLPAQDTRALPIMNALDLDPIVTDALLAEDTRPRLTIHGNGAILIVRAVNVNEGEEPEDMVSLRMWIERNLIVSVCATFVRRMECVP